MDSQKGAQLPVLNDQSVDAGAELRDADLDHRDVVCN